MGLSDLYSKLIYKSNKNNDFPIKIHKSIFDKELSNIYELYKHNINIIPPISKINEYKTSYEIIYNFYNIQLFKTYLQNNTNNIHFIINQFISFLKYLQKSNIIIYNLNINSIYLDINTFNFYIIDFFNIQFSSFKYSIHTIYFNIHLYFFKFLNHKNSEYYKKLLNESDEDIVNYYC